MVILNIAGGKISPISSDGFNFQVPTYILNVDTSYFSDETANVIEYDISRWRVDPDRTSKQKYLNMDIFEFMERTSVMFDRVVIYRFLEHVSFTQVEYFIYLVSTLLKHNGVVDVIVPNYKHLADMILTEEFHHENPDFDFHAWNILLTTELLNEPSCPHASIWTPQRMKYFWELEGRFRVSKQLESFKFDGREIYLRSLIERI